MVTTLLFLQRCQQQWHRLFQETRPCSTALAQQCPGGRHVRPDQFHTVFDPAPHFRKIMFQFFYNGYGWIYVRRYESQIVWYACTLFPEIETILRGGGWVKFHFDFEKPGLKFPKSAKYIFGLKNTPPPPTLEIFWNFLSFVVSIKQKKWNIRKD